MSTDIMVGGSGVLTIGPTIPNTTGCNAVVLDNTFPAHPNTGLGWDWNWQPIGPAPVPSYHACYCYGFPYYTTQHCCKCSAKAMDELAKLLAPKGPTPMATPTVADTLLTQAKSRMAEIQKRLDEVPALESEISRLRRMVDAAEGK